MPARSISTCLFAALVTALGGSTAPARAADIDWGVRAGVYDDADAGFLGGELLFGLEHSKRWYVNPNLEWVFVDNGDLFTLNGDVHYDAIVRDDYSIWVGAGPAVIFRNHDRPFRDDKSDTDLGLDLLAGAGFNPHGSIRPYVQGKLVLSGDTEAVLAVGVRF